ncbi:MAG TPA: hypothetical protein VGE90_14535, partial [Chitinophaga sp.]
MKKINTASIILSAGMLLAAGACNKNLEPYSGKSNEVALLTPEDLQTATYGSYAALVDRMYIKNENQIGEYMGDDVA